MVEVDEVVVVGAATAAGAAAAAAAGGMIFKVGVAAAAAMALLSLVGAALTMARWRRTTAMTVAVAVVAVAATTVSSTPSRPVTTRDRAGWAVRLRNGNLVEDERLLSTQCSRFFADHDWDQLHQRRRVELGSARRRSTGCKSASCRA